MVMGYDLESKDKVVEVNVKLCGLNSLDNFQLMISLEDTKNLEKIIDDIYIKIKYSKSREEIETIFMDIIVKLDSYGFFRDLSIGMDMDEEAHKALLFMRGVLK